MILFFLLAAGAVQADVERCVKNAMASYVASYPDYPDLPVGWMRVVIDGLESSADKSATVTPLTIKAFVIGQSPNDHPHRAERAGTFASALHQWCGGLPEQQMTGRDLIDALNAVYTESYPPPKIPVLPPNYPEGQP